MDTKEDLLSFIEGEVKKFLKPEDTKYTQNALALRMGVSKSTISRVVNGDITSLSDDSAFLMLSYLFGEKEASQMMKKPYPNWFETYGSSRAANKRQGLPIAKTEWDSETIELFDLGTTTGFDLVWLKEQFGQRGVDKANRLVQQELLFRKGDTYCGAHELYYDPDYKRIYQHIKHDVNKFDTDRIGSGAWLHRMIQPVSSKASEDLKNIVRKFIQDLENRIQIDQEDKSTTKHENFRLSAVGDFKKSEEQK